MASKKVKIELNKKQKLVILISISLVFMIILHFFIFAKRVKILKNLRNQYNQIKEQYKKVKQQQKPPQVLNEFLKTKKEVLENIQSNLKKLLLYNAPEIKPKEEKNNSSTPQPQHKPQSKKIDWGIEKTLSPDDSDDVIYKVYIEKILKIKELEQNAKNTQIKVFENWKLEDKIKNFDENAFPDIINNLRVEYEVIGRKGVSEDVVKASKLRAVRLRRELGLNMRMLNNPDKFIVLMQKMLYVHFLENKIPPKISLKNLITYMDIKFPRDEDGGLLVGFQALLTYTIYMLELADKCGIKSFDKIKYKEIAFEGKEGGATGAPAVPAGPAGMIAPGMGFDPRMMRGMPGMPGVPGVPGMPGMNRTAPQPSTPGTPQQTKWDTTKSLRVSFDIEFKANNLEGMKFLTTLVEGPGFFHIKKLTINRTEEEILKFNVSLFTYCWINIKNVQ